MRKAYYYYNKERVPEEGARRLQQSITPPIIRGLAVEAALARMLFPPASGGDSASQKIERHKRFERDGTVCRVDLAAADSDTIIEVKDTSVGRRLVPADIHFKGYLMQVLYYMVIAEKEEALLLINYSSRELVWHHNDSDGRSWFYRPPANAKGPGIECWHISMSKDDYARKLLWEQMLRRKNAFLKAMEANDVSMLPRVRMHDRRLKCAHCPF
jgi:hypothetical protein